MDKRLAHYTRSYFTKPRNWEIKQWAMGNIRRDMACAFAYALGCTSFAKACAALGVSADPGVRVSLPYQRVFGLAHKATRDPGRVVDIGAGRGELSALLIEAGCDVVAIDPAPGAYPLWLETVKRYCGQMAGTFIQATVDDGISQIGAASTVILCESLEHIPRPEFMAAWPTIKDMLTLSAGLLIITNQASFHPLYPDKTGWDHITLVDDALYHRLAADARTVVLKHGSHLVLAF